MQLQPDVYRTDGDHLTAALVLFYCEDIKLQFSWLTLCFWTPAECPGGGARWSNFTTLSGSLFIT